MNKSFKFILLMAFCSISAQAVIIRKGRALNKWHERKMKLFSDYQSVK